MERMMNFIHFLAFGVCDSQMLLQESIQVMGNEDVDKSTAHVAKDLSERVVLLKEANEEGVIIDGVIRVKHFSLACTEKLWNSFADISKKLFYGSMAGACITTGVGLKRHFALQLSQEGAIFAAVALAWLVVATVARKRAQEAERRSIEIRGFNCNQFYNDLATLRKDVLQKGLQANKRNPLLSPSLWARLFTPQEKALVIEHELKVLDRPESDSNQLKSLVKDLCWINPPMQKAQKDFFQVIDQIKKTEAQLWNQSKYQQFYKKCIEDLKEGMQTRVQEKEPFACQFWTDFKRIESEPLIFAEAKIANSVALKLVFKKFYKCIEESPTQIGDYITPRVATLGKNNRIAAVEEYQLNMITVVQKLLLLKVHATSNNDPAYLQWIKKKYENIEDWRSFYLKHNLTCEELKPLMAELI